MTHFRKIGLYLKETLCTLACYGVQFDRLPFDKKNTFIFRTLVHSIR